MLEDSTTNYISCSDPAVRGAVFLRKYVLISMLQSRELQAAEADAEFLRAALEQQVL